MEGEQGGGVNGGWGGCREQSLRGRVGWRRRKERERERVFFLKYIILLLFDIIFGFKYF